MADERDRERTGDAPRDLDGLGRDAAHAHGDAGGATQGGSVGRRTMGNAGDDLLGIDASAPGADDRQQADDATSHQRESGMRRQGLEGKGFDAGGGYGGGGNDSLYNAEAGYGGQAGGRESASMRGAYAGDDFGREGDDDASSGGSGSGNGGTTRGADLPRGTDEHGGDASTGGRRANTGDDDRDPVDLDVTPDVGRRDPTR